ncbi:arabinose efflux permease family protein [Frateuria aurantia DSM 6220]|uniref:Arabinose efflux permease family protein n=2 Tax=Frateuria aurantia TaxID=81475 RepID=H8KYH8_FRAAD|nr:arabinose efflux permease family protein [Frateuria aurantia DSM 6220]
MAVAPAGGFRRSLLAMSGLALVLMLSALDQTVVGTALPRIAEELHGFDRYTWVATSYLLASVISLPIAGRLGDHHGRKPFVLAATIIFVLASLGCGAAATMDQLIVARGCQGIGGGMLIGTAFACIPELFPDTRQRLRWQMLLSMAFSIVNATGPMLGGMLTQDVSWRWVFYINLPLGLLALILVYRHLPWLRPMSGSQTRFDWRGAAWLAVLLGAGQAAVQWHAHPVWPALAAGLALVRLLREQPRTRHPLLPPVMFADPGLRGLFGLSLLAGAIMFSLLFYLPLLFQAGYGYSPRTAGWLITPLVLCITLGAIFNGRIVARLEDPRRLPLTGFVLLMLACVGIAVSGRGAGPGLLLSLTFAAGLGLGLILMNLTLFTQARAHREHLGIATAVCQGLRLVGGMLGAALAERVVNGVYPQALARQLAAMHLPTMASAWSSPGSVLRMPMRAGVAAPEPMPWIQAWQAARHSLIQSVDVVCLLLGLLALAALIWLMRLPRISLQPPLSSSGQPAEISSPD